ncbi:MAG TPA: glycosyltransferase [Gemmatimonadales bacterium]
MNIVIAGGGTGGHLMPALALAAALRRRRADLDPVLVGAVRGVDRFILPQREYRHYLLPTEPIYRHQWWRNVRWPMILPRLLRQVGELLDREQPALVVGTGGYASAPVLYLASRRGIPIALQEQNAWPGIATRRLSRRARQIHLGYPEARARLRVGPDTVVYDSGNPIVPPLAVAKDAARRGLGLPERVPAILVMGGSQGARALNEATSAALDAGLFGAVSVLWSTGARTFPRYACHASDTVLVKPFWDPIGDAYAAVDLVVGRAGAMTTAELAAWKLPSVLVPLPGAAADHQRRNAEALAAAGAAIHLPESALSPARLATECTGVLGDPARRARIAQSAAARARPGAADEIAARLIEIVA